MAHATKEPLSTLRKNKVIASITIAATLIVPLKFFLEIIPLPATQKDLQEVKNEQVELSTKVDTLAYTQIHTILLEVENLERNRADYVIQRLQIEEKMKDKGTNTTTHDVDLYFKSLLQLDINIRTVDQRILELREKAKELNSTLF